MENRQNTASNGTVAARPRLEYDAVERLFPDKWEEGREEYWFRKAWDILGRQGLTAYGNNAEKATVLIRAEALGMIFEDFCQRAFEEEPDYLDVMWNFEDVMAKAGIAEAEIWHLTGRICPDEVEVDDEGNGDFEDVETDLSLNDLLIELSDEERPAVLAALRKELDDSFLAAGMYFTGCNPLKAADYVDEDGSDYFPEDYEMSEEEYEEEYGDIRPEARHIRSVEEYWQFLEEEFHGIVGYAMSDDVGIMAAHEWLHWGAERLGN